jgi:hypothetical protein
MPTHGGYHAFVRHSHGTIDPFEAPGAPTSPGAGTVAYSINQEGVTTGEYFGSAGPSYGFSRAPGGQVTNFDAPGAGIGQGTRPSTNNASGEVAGWWTDQSGLNHGFLWVP